MDSRRSKDQLAGLLEHDPSGFLTQINDRTMAGGDYVAAHRRKRCAGASWASPSRGSVPRS